MARCHLRIFHGPDASSQVAKGDENSVTLPLGDIAPLLAEAVHDGRMWLRDFKHDEITISTDLYEVLLAYQHFRRPSA